MYESEWVRQARMFGLKGVLLNPVMNSVEKRSFQSGVRCTSKILSKILVGREIHNRAAHCVALVLSQDSSTEVIYICGHSLDKSHFSPWLCPQEQVY